jgi:Tetratricopeptide repeat
MGLFDFAGALEGANKAVQKDPKSATAYKTRGNAHKGLNHFDEALADYLKSRELDPESIETDLNLALLYMETLDTEKCLEELDTAAKKVPNHPEIMWTKALLMLREGKYEEGWALYEHRWRLPRQVPMAQFMSTPWNGVDTLKDRTIIIHSEQGFGDTIQFIRYVKELTKLGATVVLEVEPELEMLFKGIKEISYIVKKGGHPRPYYDYHCALVSLPFLLKTTVETIPPVLDIEINLETIDKWNKILGPKNKLRIGIVWSGKTGFVTDHKRSMSFEQFVQALPVGPEYICLQKEIKETDKKSLKKRRDIKIINKQLTDFSDTAAVIKCLDLVIGTETSVPVLSATLGVETWIVIQHGMDWRWMLERSDSPWFPAAKLYRQPSLTSGWDPVITKVREDIEKLNSST